MNILLIAINAKYIHSNPAVFSLKACTGEYEQHVDIVEFTINQHPSFILQEIYKRRPDVAAFSCYIWNRSILDSIIPDLHKILPDTDIWAGGPEVSYDAAETIRKWKLRGVMAGAGEGEFRRLTEAYVKGDNNGLPEILDESNTPRLSLNEIPFWYKDLSDFENRIIYYESSRGCPFSCSYCLSSIDRVLDFRSVQRVCKELDFFLERKVPQVKFIDRTFNCKKEHALPILSHILEHDNGITNFHFEIAADLFDEDYFELLEKMRPGAVQLEIGVQSTYRDTIAEINRKMDFSKVADVVRRISSWHNIHIHLDLIAGLPYEDLQTFQTSFNDVYALFPQQLQLGFLKVLKGSDMESKAAEYDLLYTQMPPYEVLSTKWLSYEDVCRLKQLEEVVEIYYNSGQFANTLSFLLPFFDTPYDMYDALAAWYERKGLFGVQLSRITKYEILLDFGIAKITKYMQRKRLAGQIQTESQTEERQSAVLKEYIIYDFYLREHVRNRPPFALPSEKWKENVYDILHREAQTHELLPELSNRNYRELTRDLHVEVFEYIYDEPAAVVFCYESHDALSNNCKDVKVFLSQLE